MSVSRRELITKGAAAGGLVWAAPAISTISSKAAAASPGCVCTSAGTGLRGSVTLLGNTTTLGPFGTNGCVANVDVLGVVLAQTVCGSASGDPDCTAEASLVSLQIGFAGVPAALVQVGAATANVSAPNTTPCGAASGSSTLASLSIGGNPIVISGAPNQAITLGPVSVIINEQCCNASGQSVVRALHVVVSDPLNPLIGAEVVVAEAVAGASCCPTCNFGPACT